MDVLGRSIVAAARVMAAGLPAKEGHHLWRWKEERPTLCCQTAGLCVSDLV